MAVLTLATIGLYYEFEVRSVPIGSVVIKGTTLLWIIWSAALARMLVDVRERGSCHISPVRSGSP